MTDIIRFLNEHEIPYEACHHPPVFTVEEADRLVPELPGAKTKNLFLRDARGKRHFLVVSPSDKPVDLKKLKDVIGSSKLGFASPQRLNKYLGVEPGAVSLLGVVNDTEKAVEVFVDRAIWDAEAVLSHPLVNTATLVLAQESVRRFFAATGHDPAVIDIPEREIPPADGG